MTTASTPILRRNDASATPSLAQPLLYSLVGHVVLITLFSLHLHWKRDEPVQSLGPVMNAQLVDMRPASRPPPPVVKPQIEPEPQPQPDTIPEPVPDDTAAKAAEEAEAKRVLAEQEAAARANEVAERAAREAKIKALELEAKKKKEQEEKADLEKQRKEKLEAERRQKLEDEKKAKELAEQKRKEDELRQKDEAEKKRKAEQEKQRKAEQARRQKAEDDLAQQMEDEAAQYQAHHKQILTEKEKYKLLIQNKIQRNWNKPANPIGSCKLNIRLGPGGVVLFVSEGEGDVVLCRSAAVAVRKAEPLPVSSDPEVFQEIRDINLTMDPTKSVF